MAVLAAALKNRRDVLGERDVAARGPGLSTHTAGAMTPNAAGMHNARPAASFQPNGCPSRITVSLKEWKTHVRR